MRWLFLTHPGNFFWGLEMGTMSQTLLHLVDQRGQTLPVAIRLAVEAAHRWVRWEYPHLDEAVVAGWAEDVGKAMGARLDEIRSPYRYAFAALHGKVREWFRSNASREVLVGIGRELELWAGIDRSTQRVIYRAVLFDQLKTKLSERDRHILVLLQQDITGPASVAAALGVSYAAAAKAIQRVKERIAAILVGAPTAEEVPVSPHPCESESGG
jgi:DNA-directed RNA polymerase specialized sigma24 family protein